MKITKAIAMTFMVSATLSMTSVCSAAAAEDGISERQKRLKVLGLTPPAGSQSQPGAGQVDNQLQSDQSQAAGKSGSADGSLTEDTMPGEEEAGVIEAEIATSVQPSKPEQDREAEQRVPGPSLTRDRESSPAGGKAHNGQTHWGYSGAGAPYYWAGLQPEFTTCGRGRNQSPIHISTVTVTTLPAVHHDYQEVSLQVVNNGHAIQVNYPPGSVLAVAGKRYTLLQFHFHSPSEHTIGGKYYPMVMHMVHQAADGELAVIAVMLEEGRRNETIEKIWAAMPEASGQTAVENEVNINAAALLPQGARYVNYSGSLTTPPCTEGVNWLVMMQPIEVSREQIERFQKLYFANNRPVQPLNGRILRMSN